MRTRGFQQYPISQIKPNKEEMKIREYLDETEEQKATTQKFDFLINLLLASLYSLKRRALFRQYDCPKEYLTDDRYPDFKFQNMVGSFLSLFISDIQIHIQTINKQLHMITKFF